MRATKFPCVEYAFDFIETEAVVPDGLWYVNISIQRESQTLIFESVKNSFDATSRNRARLHKPRTGTDTWQSR